MIGEFFNPMLVSSIKNIEGLGNPCEVALQPKLDGIRLQLHKKEDKVWIYSRSGLLVNDKFVEIIESVRKLPQDFILDCEAISFNKDKISFDKILEKFKTGKGKANLVAFDILNLNGFNLIDKTFYERRAHLEKLKQNKFLTIVPQIITYDSAKIKKYYINCIKSGFEGIVIKKLDSVYEPKRSFSVMKLKPIRTLDVKVIGISQMKFGYYSYDAAVKEGLIAKVPSKTHLKTNDIIEIRHEGFVDSKKYPLGKTVRFPSFLRIRNDLAEPNSLNESGGNL